MTCTAKFWAFFKPLAEAVPGVKTVHRSGGDKMDRLLANSRSEEIYPAVFLLRPKYTLEDNGANLTIAWFDATYYVICTGNYGDELDEDASFDEAERLATKLTRKLQEEESTYLAVIDPTTKVYMEPVTMLTLDSSFGYEVRYRIGLMVNPEVYEGI
ncbi:MULTISPECIES: hypothetical protein [unclassified Spirosoma]|uniref:hypothetical protein n=1 Tax=unclassified Spirosoma TaxID=2621999 RepID=UPI00095C6838|nr:MULTISPECIES: hypothetical protein [unclassified Spirosoma]MBN8820765.1 hypothetical protein [Spirosoma sp.]OJW76358.1 MAG: hypothetical protein BGO59_22830 [Spirosoma sp. 48-14]